jgi:hypothetical protein
VKKLNTKLKKSILVERDKFLWRLIKITGIKYFFAEVLLNQLTYRELRNEISRRRKEIKGNKVILHQDFWQDL